MTDPIVRLAVAAAPAAGAVVGAAAGGAAAGAEVGAAAGAVVAAAGAAGLVGGGPLGCCALGAGDAGAWHAASSEPPTTRAADSRNPRRETKVRSGMTAESSPCTRGQTQYW